MNVKIYVLFLMFLLMAAPCAGINGSVGDPLQKIVLNYPNGKKFNSDVLSGKNPLMMVFWATWCLNCTKEIPELKKIFSRYEPRGLKIIGVNVGVRDTVKAMDEYVTENSIPYPVAFDQGSVVTKYFKIKYIPTVIITDKKGIIKYRSHKLPDDFNTLYHELIQ